MDLLDVVEMVDDLNKKIKNNVQIGEDKVMTYPLRAGTLIVC